MLASDHQVLEESGVVQVYIFIGTRAALSGFGPTVNQLLKGQI